MSVRRIVWLVVAVGSVVWGAPSRAQSGNTPPPMTIHSAVVTVTAGAVATNSGTY